MSVTEFLRNTLLKRICYATAFSAYHLVTFYDKALAVRAIFWPQVNDKLEVNHRFEYPRIRLNSLWHTTRLIKLAPGTGVEPLEGTLLTTVTIKIFSWAWNFGEPRYDAISYCWGDCKVTKMIHLNGALLPVTETLHGAIQSLRKPESCRLLWADQICIDQSQAAVDERSQQVQRMGEIYENADNVIIWLGKPTAFSDRIFDSLTASDESLLPHRPDDVERQAIQTRSQAESEPTSPPLLNTWLETSAADQDGQMTEQLKSGLDELVNNAWFTRIWVLQEAALARNLFIQAGSRRIQWRRFVAYVRSLQNKTEHLAENMRLVYDIEMLRQQRLSDELEDDDLLMMVEEFRGRQATDFRDKIYGLFGLITSRSPSLAFQADYSKPVEQVFVDFALWHIQLHGNVRVLSKCCSEEVRDMSAMVSEQRGLPSWATNWSVTSSSECGDLVDDSFQPKTGRQLYSASRGLRADARVVSDQSEASSLINTNLGLVLNGVIVDTVDEVAHRMHKWAEDSDLQSATWMEWRQLALEERSADPYRSRDDHVDAFWRTLVVDRKNILERASPDVGEDFKLLLDASDVNLNLNDHLSGGLETTLRSCEESDNRGRLNKRFAVWLQKWNSVHLGKRIFRTERGYLGISCEHIQKGDKVAILCGGRLPFLLRKHGDILLPGARGRPSLTDDTVVPTYQLIGGECYVHGLADGEGLEIAERVGIVLTKICLV